MHYRCSHCDYRQMDIWGRTPIITRPYQSTLLVGTPRERLFIFRELGSTGNYFREAGEQALNFRDSCPKVNNKF